MNKNKVSGRTKILILWVIKILNVTNYFHPEATDWVGKWQTRVRNGSDRESIIVRVTFAKYFLERFQLSRNVLTKQYAIYFYL